MVLGLENTASSSNVIGLSALQRVQATSVRVRSMSFHLSIEASPGKHKPPAETPIEISHETLCALEQLKAAEKAAAADKEAALAAHRALLAEHEDASKGKKSAPPPPPALTESEAAMNSCRLVHDAARLALA